MAFQNTNNAALNLQATYRGGAITRANATSFIPELWSSEVQRERDLTFVASRYVKMVTGQFSKGDRLNIPRISRAAVNVKLPETPVFLQTRTDSSFFLDIDRYMESSFMIEDIVNIQAAYNLRAEYTREAGYALGRDIDNYLLALRAVINAIPAQRVISAAPNTALAGTFFSEPLNYSSILTAKLRLDQAAVPDSDRVLVVSPTGYNQLLAVDKFISMDYRNTAPVATGQVGTLFNIPVIMSTNLIANSTNGYVNGAGATPQATPGVTGSPYSPTQDTALPLQTAWSPNGTTGFYGGASSPTNPVVQADPSIGGTEVHTAILMHKDFAIMAMQKAPSAESSRETLYLADALVMSQVYGGRVFRPDHAVVIHHDGTIPALG